MVMRIGTNNSFESGGFQQAVNDKKPATDKNAALIGETLPQTTAINPNETFALRSGIDSSRQKRLALQNQLTAAQTSTEPAEQSVFKTIGGTWRKDSEGIPRFYRTGADTAGTTRFDEEYYHPDPQKYPQAEGKWIRLNASGGARDLPANKDKARPEKVSDFDWKGYEWIDEKNVPADYATIDKAIAFADPKLAENQLNALKRYVVDNNLIEGTWDEAKFTNIFSAQAGKEIKLELEKVGEADGKTIFKVRIDEEGLARLRTGLEQYRQEVGEDAVGGVKGQQEVTRMAEDIPGAVYETGRKIVDGVINVVPDSLNLVLFPPFSPRTGSEPNFGRAKVGEMYDELSNRPMAETNGSGPIPRIETTPLKYEFQSEMMRRGIFTGKVDDSISTGDAATTATSVIAPLVVGKVFSPESVQTLKSSGALPEVKSVTTVKAVGETTANEPIQTIKNKFPNDPLPTDGEIYGIAKVENGKISLNKQIGTDRQIDFVVDKQGNLVLGSKHSLLGNADEVQAAGTMKIVNGKAKVITNLSGHYQPSLEEARKFPDILRKMGLDLKGTKLELSEFENTPSGYVVGNGRIVVNEYLKY